MGAISAINITLRENAFIIIIKFIPTTVTQV